MITKKFGFFYLFFIAPNARFLQEAELLALMASTYRHVTGTAIGSSSRPPAMS